MNKVLLMAVVGTLFAGICAGNVLAQQKSEAIKRAEAAKAATTQKDDGDDVANVSGTVNVTKDKKTGDTTDLELLTQSGFKFKITRNADSKYLEQKNGESLELTGVISQKDGQKWLTIKKPPVMTPVDDKGEGKQQKKKAAKKEQAEKKPPKKYKFDY
jgi:hypothetical protein